MTQEDSFAGAASDATAFSRSHSSIRSRQTRAEKGDLEPFSRQGQSIQKVMCSIAACLQVATRCDKIVRRRTELNMLKFGPTSPAFQDKLGDLIPGDGGKHCQCEVTPGQQLTDS